MPPPRLRFAPMRVLFITGLTGFGLGGARTEEIRLLRRAAQAGCETAMCSDVLADELAGTRHFRLDYPPGERAAGQADAAVAAFAPEVVHVVGGGIRFLATCDRQLRAVPWVFTAHNVPPAERILSRFHGNSHLHYAVRNTLALPSVWSWRKFLKRGKFARTICHSNTVARRLEEVGCPTEKIVEIPFGSELPPAAFAQDPAQPTVFPPGAYPRLLTIAGLAHHKGQFDAVRMAGRLMPDFPKLSYCLIGMTRDRNYRAFLEKTIRDLGLAERVMLLHAASEAAKFSALREADLYIQPSHEEGFCIAFLEAAMLTPRLIGADTGAIAAMAANDVMARVAPPGNIAALESAARELLARQADPPAIIQRRQRLRASYSWDAYLAAHLQAYRDALS
ncbi:MAG TPA: glycosyltransferase [Tepidisphaeraceae bacterium]|nr:glycosyltransferase [Tepidisphaeraceae bacterium]